MDATQFAEMLDLLRQTLTAVAQGSTGPAGPDPGLMRPTKMTAEDRPEAYLEVFEALATSAGWDQAQWASCLLPQLTGEAQASSENAISRPDDGLPHAQSHHPESRGGHTGGISEEVSGGAILARGAP
ncbi:UNVERIFIED_CONTAM: hypothetical protein FKN15_067065 [Acipenser sinensis]